MKLEISILFSIFIGNIFSQISNNSYQHYADKLFNNKQYEDAFRAYGDAIKADKESDNNYSLYLNAGDCAYILNYKQIAFNYYGLAAKRKSPTHELIKHINSIHCNNDPLCNAEALKEITIKHPETKSNIYPEIATLLFDQAYYEKTIPILQEYLLLQPNNLSMKKMLAETFFNIEQIDSTRTLYHEIAESHPDDFDSFVFLGNYYYVAANQCSQINSDKKKNSSFFPQKENSQVYLNTEAISLYKKAEEYLENAYTIYKSEEIKKSLIKIYTITGNKNKIVFFKE